MIAASALLLSGCAAETPAPTKPTASEISTFTERIANIEVASGELQYNERSAFQTAGGAISQGLGNAGKVKPLSVYLSALDNVTRQLAFETCMLGSGYQNGSTYSRDVTARNPTDFFFQVNESNTETACRHTAGAMFIPSDPYSGLLGASQRDYVYDYYEHFLVPCLAAHGLYLVGSPTRSQFSSAWEDPGWWTPYESLNSRPTDDDLSKLEVECSPMPPGFT